METFAEDGPTMCSGLPNITPRGAVHSFVYVRLRVTRDR